MTKRTIGHYGEISEYEKDKEHWISNIEMIMLFFKTNEIEEDSKKRAILLSSVGSEMYKVIKSLAKPNKPSEKSFTEMVDFLKEHQVHKPNKIAKRFKFNMKDRKEGETLSEYLAELYRLR